MATRLAAREGRRFAGSTRMSRVRPVCLRSSAGAHDV